MHPPLRLCVCLVLIAACSARPSWHKGIMGEDHPGEERVNLHHTLKDLQNSATKAVKDVHKYFHQRLNTVAKTSVEKIGKPLATVVLGPAILMKETLDALAGKRRPPPQEDIPSWCPSCLENDHVDQTQFHPQVNTPKPCYEPDCHVSYKPDESKTSPSAFSQETQPEDSSLVPSENLQESETVGSSELYPPPYSGFSGNPTIEAKKKETDIDIRFGNETADEE